MHCLGDDFVDEADDWRIGLVSWGAVPKIGDGPFGESPNPLDDFFFVCLDRTDENAGRNLDVVNQVVIACVSDGYRKNAGLLAVIQRQCRVSQHLLLRQETQSGLGRRILELEGHAELVAVRVCGIDRDEVHGYGTQDYVQCGVGVAYDIDGILGEVAFFGNDNLVHVAFFGRKDDGAVRVCLEALGCLHFVCKFDVGVFYGFSGNFVGDDDCVAYRNAAVFILEAGRKENGQRYEYRNENYFVHGNPG